MPLFGGEPLAVFLPLCSTPLAKAEVQTAKTTVFCIPLL
jgi:hypothetical protein